MNIKNDILLIIPDERKVYEDINVKAGAFHTPSLAIAILSQISKNNGYKSHVLDLSFYDVLDTAISSFMLKEALRYICITCTTATYSQAMEIARIIKQNKKTDIEILIGGPHVSSLVDETLDTDLFDYVFIGESEISFDRFLKGENPANIEGIAFKKGDDRFKKYNKGFIPNLDEMPFPDYSVYDLSKYHISKLQAKNNPVVWIETSRGCPFDCQICNKSVHGQTFRPKSSDRVLNEIKMFLQLGIKEFHIADDGFTSNMKRAEEICDRIIDEKIKFSWACVNGIRVDRVNYVLLKKMKKAGCYRISFGIESGNQKVLDVLGKRVTLDRIEKAVKMAKKARLEVFGFFMFGFENDTELTMTDTIKFSKKLKLDLAKASIIIPFPGSPLYKKYKDSNLIYDTKDFRYYNVYMSPNLVYEHPTLDWDIIEKYQKYFYRSFYLNPAYIIRRLAHSFRTGTIFSDINVALHTKWFSKSLNN